MRALPVAFVLASAVMGCGRVGFEAAGGSDATGGGDAVAGLPFELDLGVVPSQLRGAAELPDGAVAVTGVIGGDARLGSASVTGFGGMDIIVAVVEPDGRVRWASSFGSAGDDEGCDVAAGADGSIYVTGFIAGPTSFGEATLVPSGEDTFVASFTAAGAPRWAVRFDGSGGTTIEEAGFGISAEPGGGVLVAGRSIGTIDFGNGMLAASGAQEDAFVVKLEGADGSVVWARRWGAAGWNQSFGVTADSAGNVYVAGSTSSTPDFGGGLVVNRGGDDVFVVSLDRAGAHRWSRTFGGTGDEWGFGVAVSDQTVVVTGYYDGTINLAVPASRGMKDGFVASYSLAGVPGWALGFGGPGCDSAGAITSTGGELVFAAEFTGTIDLGDGPRTSMGGSDALIAAITPSGAVTWTRSDGAAAYDSAGEIAGARATGLYVVGVLGYTPSGPGCTDYPVGGLGYLRHL